MEKIARTWLALTCIAALAIVACETPTVDEEKKAATANELGFAGSGDWTVFKLQAGPNPATNIKGEVRGFVSPEIDRTVLVLNVSGLPANQTFGAHLHAAPCNDNSGGGHYQHVGTAVNDENEVWLDFTTNGGGVAHVVARKSFAIATERAKSVVVHAKATDPATGKAGDKLACTDVTFTEANPPGNPAPPRAPNGNDGADGKDGDSNEKTQCSVSYSCINNVCKCSDDKEGTSCANPADCEKVCAVCK